MCIELFLAILYLLILIALTIFLFQFILLYKVKNDKISKLKKLEKLSYREEIKKKIFILYSYFHTSIENKQKNYQFKTKSQTLLQLYLYPDDQYLFRNYKTKITVKVEATGLKDSKIRERDKSRPIKDKIINKEFLEKSIFLIKKSKELNIERNTCYYNLLTKLIIAK